MQYKVIRGFSVDDLETKVNYFLDQQPSPDRPHANYYVHGEIQMFGHSEFVQVLTRII